MTGFKPGEIVDITIKGARVVNTYPTAHKGLDGVREDTGTVIVVSLDEARRDDMSVAVNLKTPGVTVERVAPEWWPPRPGDLLREGDGLIWFAYADDSNVVCRTAYSERMEHEDAWEKRHDLTLVHREGNQRGQVVFEDPLTARLDEQGEVPL